MDAIENILEDYESPLQAEHETDCPICDGRGVYLGTLARLHWYRCESCGIEYNIPS